MHSLVPFFFAKRHGFCFLFFNVSYDTPLPWWLGCLSFTVNCDMVRFMIGYRICMYVCNGEGI
jgi:hypothetical protein